MEQSTNQPLTWQQAAEMIRNILSRVQGEPEPINPAVAAQNAYATAWQKEEIIRLLNHPAITRQEKTKALLNLNKHNPEQADVAIAKLKQDISDRTYTPSLDLPIINAAVCPPDCEGCGPTLTE